MFASFWIMEGIQYCPKNAIALFEQYCISNSTDEQGIIATLDMHHYTICFPNHVIEDPSD
ncbi:hypothetical protein KSZ_59130 [Dictyobacter formicarum]|uniref:Uncharacterized protein n=1 Tax=Dictyobacter formicarum TaxID=2778368 RepID=A0ABQ3VPX6_9CHLR|nr:hypothetical protein KSZ_59130 [Dictyobacter formicarum]